MNKIKMIVGLGNSVYKYNQTRHNVGFWYINMLSSFYKTSLKFKKKFSGYVSSFFLNNNKIFLLKPDLFMNLNGYSVFALSSFYKIKLSEILVVRDELDLSPGILKVKYGIGHNGHNGVKSIINTFEKKKPFIQLCIGIGRPEFKKNVSNFVLECPSKIDTINIKKAILKFIFLTKDYIYKKEFLKNKKIILI
ncbi:aminoacyl-tRNA hydrolase [Buchnera aphidicola]|uniref:Peptidyl-tRNA hydrolase n=1 Tax=Buchnera aphidicola subsp. Cinara cedri (strain Cc) TaxID=372461 RepID=PTH_BUCCC|nr:RecName: Full=Peptidyl-tRNA hydrolase; Short=PTH [Buchnera aphidicola BCc]ABJ90599.1 peptidyl-tRNA hydrolase [Buchnera aphidicola BCc]